VVELLFGPAAFNPVKILEGVICGGLCSSMRRRRDESGEDLRGLGHVNLSQSRPETGHRRDLQMSEENAHISRAKGAFE
jgi:hypothetical protein